MPEPTVPEANLMSRAVVTRMPNGQLVKEGES